MTNSERKKADAFLQLLELLRLVEKMPKGSPGLIRVQLQAGEARKAVNDWIRA